MLLIKLKKVNILKRQNEAIKRKKKHNKKMINSTETKTNLFRMFRWRYVNIRKVFQEVINVFYGQSGFVLTDFDPNCVTGNVETENFR